MPTYQPRVDDIRVAKVPETLDGENKHWIWRFEIDGRWEFVAAKTEVETGDYVRDLEWEAEDDTYDYWRR